MNWLVQDIETWSLGQKFRVLTTRPQVLMCRDLNYDGKINILLQKIDMKKPGPFKEARYKELKNLVQMLQYFKKKFKKKYL